MKYHTFFFFRKLRKMLQKLLSAAVVIGALRVKHGCQEVGPVFPIYIGWMKGSLKEQVGQFENNLAQQFLG